MRDPRSCWWRWLLMMSVLLTCMGMTVLVRLLTWAVSDNLTLLPTQEGTCSKLNDSGTPFCWSFIILWWLYLVLLSIVTGTVAHLWIQWLGWGILKDCTFLHGSGFITPEDVAAWLCSVGILLDLSSSLNSLQCPVGEDDLGTFGRRCSGYRLLTEKATHSHTEDGTAIWFLFARR